MTPASRTGGMCSGLWLSPSLQWPTALHLDAPSFQGKWVAALPLVTTLCSVALLPPGVQRGHCSEQQVTEEPGNRWHHDAEAGPLCA